MVLNGARTRLAVSWFDAWSRELDDALDALPEMPACSHDLYRTLATTPSVARKRFAIVREADAPIAAIALRRRFRHWELLCDGVVPFADAPALPGRLWDALAALRQYVRIVEWAGEPPMMSGVFVLQREPGYAVSTRIDLDAYWASKGNAGWLKKARRRTERLGHVALEVDRDGAAAWTIERWHDKWASDPAGETAATEDILAAARHLARHRRYHAFRLLVDGAPVAGVNTVVHERTLIMTQSYRDPAYDRAGIGVHLDERIFRWAAASPYETVDLGCGGTYKPRWAEEAGDRVTVAVAPAHLALARRAAGAVRRLLPAGLTGAARQDITNGLQAPAGNKNLTTPFRTSEGQDAAPDRRTHEHGSLSAGDATERSRGVHT